MVKIEVLDAVNARIAAKEYYIKSWMALAYTVYPYEGDPYQKSLFDRRNGKFPTGLIPLVKEKLERQGLTVKVKKPKFKKLLSNGDMHSLTVSLEDYQREVLHKIEGENRGVIISPTGSGKTIIEAAIISNFGFPKTLVIVPRRDLLYQISRKLEELLSIPKVGLIGDGREEIEAITVALYQTLVRRDLAAVNDIFDVIIVDEVQASRADSYQIIMNQLPNIHYRYGLTGTMRLKQPDRSIIQGLFGKTIAIVPEEKTEARVTDVILYMVKYEDEVEHYSTYHERVRHNIWLSEKRNRLIADIAEFLVKKLEMSCLILVEKYMQADALRHELMGHTVSAPVLWNKTSNEDRDRYKDELDRKGLMCLIATPAITVGSDIPGVESIIIGSEVKDWLNLSQKIGRGRRKTRKKNILHAVDIYNSFVGRASYTFNKQSYTKYTVYKEKGWLREVVTLEQFKERMTHEKERSWRNT